MKTPQVGEPVGEPVIAEPTADSLALVAEDIDAYPAMVDRRRLSDQYATRPIRFYERSLRIAEMYMRRRNRTREGLTEQDAVLDAGCSSGLFLINALARTRSRAFGIGVDIQNTPYRKFLPTRVNRSRFAFVHASALDTGLPNNIAKVAMAHNLLFRLPKHHRPALFAELWRLTDPDGLVFTSTNFESHAILRHSIEWRISMNVGHALGLEINHLRPPADGCFVRDMLDIISDSHGFEPIMPVVVQKGATQIMPGKSQEVFMRVLRQSVELFLARNPQLDQQAVAEARRLWLIHTERIALPIIESAYERRRRSGLEPRFLDVVRRGMSVLRVVK